MNQVVVGDRISELPWEILDNILGRLPIQNAVATTILSRKWKDKWVDVSNLLFDDSSNGTGTMDTKKFIKLVYHVLLSHRGTIDKFTLTSRSNSYSFEHNSRSWITYLSRKDIKELTLYFPPPINFGLPYSLFSCTKLRRLCITNCWVRMPDDFSGGFRDLVSLHLTACCYTDETIKKMISSSPNLEKLVLADVCYSDLISIYAPCLKYLSVDGDFGDISLENCPLLHDASIKMTKEGRGTSDNLVPLPPDWLCYTRRLVMSGHFLKFLAERYNWHGASVDYHNLEVLELHRVHFDDSDEMAVALSILRRASNLNILIIDGVGTYKRDIYRSSEALNQGKCCFNKLRVVRIAILREYTRRKEIYIPEGSETNTSFLGIIRLLLAGSPVLENMDIHYVYYETCDIWFMKKLLSCERASSQLKLTYNSNY